MQTGGPTTTTITSTLFDTKINKQSQSINQSVNAPREPTPTPTATEDTHSPTPLRKRSRRRRISREGSMFQALATLSLLLATATATANTDTDAAAQLQAEATGAALGSVATPFGSKQLTRCRQSCYQQFARDWHYCTDFVDCRNCWQNCQRQLAPFELRVHHAQRQGALVLTDIGWDELIANASRQCLITWEVSGGGLMGNLLTDTARAELSLWPDTVYNIQVTCKHKLTGLMRRSLKLNVDTHQLLSSAALLPDGASTRTNNRRTIASRLQPVSISATSKTTSKATGAAAAAAAASAVGTAGTGAQHVLVHPTDRVYIISSLPTASQLSGVVYPAFGALAFFLALLVMFLFLRPQRKRTTEDAASDTASLLSTARRGSRLSTTLDNSTLHV